MGTLIALPDGGCRLEGSTSNPAMNAGEWLADIPHPLVVDGDDVLRAAVADLAARLTRAVGPTRGAA